MIGKRIGLIGKPSKPMRVRRPNLHVFADNKPIDEVDSFGLKLDSSCQGFTSA